MEHEIELAKRAINGNPRLRDIYNSKCTKEQKIIAAFGRFDILNEELTKLIRNRWMELEIKMIEATKISL